MPRPHEIEIESNEGGEGDVDSQVDSQNNQGQDIDANSEERGDSGGTAEERAARMGWKPQDQYAGKEGWIDAEDFLKRAEEEGPFLKKALKNMERRYEKLEKNTEAILAHQNRQIEAAEKQGYDRAMQEINRQMEQAVEDGDLDAHEAALKKRDEILQKKNQQTRYNHGDQDIGTQWMERNPWFNEDPVLAEYAKKKCDQLAAQGKNVKEQLEETEKYIKERFPQLFSEDESNQNSRSRRQAPHMSGTNNGTNKPRPKGRLYDNLTPQSKSECDRFVKEMTARNGKTKTEDARAEWIRFASDDMFTNLN